MKRTAESLDWKCLTSFLGLSIRPQQAQKAQCARRLTCIFSINGQRMRQLVENVSTFRYRLLEEDLTNKNVVNRETIDWYSTVWIYVHTTQPPKSFNDWKVWRNEDFKTVVEVDLGHTDKLHKGLPVCIRIPPAYMTDVSLLFEFIVTKGILTEDSGLPLWKWRHSNYKNQ